MKKMNKMAAAAVSLIFAIGATTASAAAAGTAATAGTSGSTVYSQSGPREHGDCHRGHHGAGGMNQLAKLTGMSIKDLTAKYPQQTSWQIALKLGKLSALKSAVLAEQKAMLDKMASDGMITADDSKKMYADLEKRVAAIDGKNTVILGRPGYMPQFSGERSGRGEAPHASSEPAA